MSNTPPGTWLSQIEGTHSAADMVRVLRDYLDSLTPGQRAALPRGCSAQAIQGTPEIQEWAVTLAHADLKLAGSATLHEAAVIFAAAGAKLPKLGE